MGGLNIGKPKKINQISGVPYVAGAMDGWFINITIQKVTQKIVNGDAQNITTDITFQGVFQPLDAEQLELKPEGQRSWQWAWLHTKSGSVNLKTQDKIVYNDVRYKVNSVKDYSLNGYIDYELVADYQAVA